MKPRAFDDASNNQVQPVKVFETLTIPYIRLILYSCKHKHDSCFSIL